MPKILYVATVVKTHIMEFHIPYLKMLKEMGWETAVAARNDYENPSDCSIPYCDKYYDVPFERNPIKLNNIKAYKMLKTIIDGGNYDVIHCHTPVGAALTRLAAQDARKKGARVIYTAHGFHFYKGASPFCWLTYYPIERWLSRKTDTIITINHEDYLLAREFKSSSVKYVPGIGIDINKFGENSKIRKKNRNKLGIRDTDIILLSVGEIIPRKNHEIVIRALSHLQSKEYFSQIHYLVCGTGVLQKKLKKESEKFHVSDHVHFLGYRSDIKEMLNASDIFMFMSFQEGLPVALMESMACGKAIVCSEIRGNVDLITDGFNGIFAKNEATDVANKIDYLINNRKYCERLGENAKFSIKPYSITNVMQCMKQIYFNTQQDE